MKKLFYLIVFIVTANTVLAQAGRIRISFAGFDCYRETWDDILHTDGKGDEVFLNFNCVLGDRNGNTKLSYDKRTPVYGDASGQFSNRVNVGSWTGFGHTGGIKQGDTYRCNDVIGEYDMTDGDILTVIPTMWEHDPIADNSAAFFSTLRNTYASITQKSAPYINTYHAVTGNWAWLIINAINFEISKTRPAGDQGELGRAGTRPIGMEKLGDFSPKLVLLSTSYLTRLCNSDMGYGKGVIAVNYDEVALGNVRDHGNYNIFLKVEFFPVQNTNTTTSPTNNTTYKITTPITNKTVTMGTTTTSTSIAGVWKGTWGNGSNNGPNFYSFQLNADSSMLVIDAAGKSIAAGSYSFSNNQLNGTYKYNGTNSTFSFAASLSNTQLNGTWGAGTNTSGSGRWVMSKAAVSATTNIR
ncbi:MAG: hypothetical protein KGZ74_03560 [Chitinophagaceae bacterium]|nr:hypothetical protein [Chitinophagaceae bacterium]